jgi:nucleoside-diphosphate-sugar epimerase
MWIAEMSTKPVHTQPESRNDKLSFVYSKDVAQLCVNFLAQVNEASFIKKVHNQSYNIAFNENPTLDELITMIGNVQGIPQIEWRDQKLLNGHGKYYYPSVDCGMINIDKATE